MEGVQYHPSNASWPKPDIMKTVPFDYTIHDPKYADISSVYSPGYKPSAEGRSDSSEHIVLTHNHSYIHRTFVFSKWFLILKTKLDIS